MPSFFDKLKKGMQMKDAPAAPETPAQNPKESQPPEKTKTAVAEKKTRKPRRIVEKEDAIAKAPDQKPPEEKRPALIESAVEKMPLIKTEELPEKKRIDVKPIPSLRDSLGDEKNKWQSPAPAYEPAQNNKKWFETEGQLAVDVYQTEDEIVIQAAIAGVNPKDLDIAIENDVVMIKGERGKPAEKNEQNYFYQECYWGRFSREIILPAEVDGARTEAAMKEGVLTIRIPKIEKEKRRKINVKE